MNEPEGRRTRKRVQDLHKKATSGVDKARSRSQPLDAALTQGARGLGKARDVTTKTARKADELVGSQTEKLTLADYRMELDAALDEAVEVIAAQQAEIEVLRRRLAALESQRP